MGNDRRRSISPSTTSPTSFCKIILPTVMHCHRLRVPEEFSKKYGNELSNLVKFTVRSGQVCHVGVEKADKMLWFTDGWKESENHSIGCGFCVVFNYEGNSKFKVSGGKQWTVCCVRVNGHVRVPKWWMASIHKG